MAATGSFTLGANALFLNVSATSNIYCSSNGSSNTPCYSWQQNTNTGMYWASSNVIGFSAGGNNKIVIGSNVGIGTTTPLSALHVAGVSSIMSPASSNLIAYYPFDGTVNDTVGSNIILNTSSAQSPTYVSGKIGSNAVNFSNTPGGSVVIQNLTKSSANLVLPLTIVFWARPAVITSSTFQHIFVINDSNTSDSLLCIQLTTAGYYSVYNRSAAINITTSTLAVVNRWDHIAVTIATTGVTIYVNNIVVGTQSATLNWNNVNNFSLAGSTYITGGFSWSGAIDDLRIYNRVLSDSDINFIYQNQVGGSSIYTDSRIGVGMANPSYALDVRGIVNATGGLYQNGILNRLTLSTKVSNSGGGSVRGMIWSGKLFVAANDSGSCITSQDGVTWVIRATGMSSWPHAVAYSPTLNLYVVVNALNTYNNFASSSDGITWTAGSLPNSGWRNVIWIGDKFVAVGGNGGTNSSGVVATSTNGTTWISRSIPLAYSWWGLCYSPQLGKFLTTCNLANYVMMSTDGITWTSYAMNVTGTCYLLSVCWSPALQIFCGAAGSSGLAISSDGITWTISQPAPITSTNSCNWQTVSWSQELGVFLAGALDIAGTPSHANTLAVSTNGVHWSLTSINWGYGWDIGSCWSPELSSFCVAGSGKMVLVTLRNNTAISWISSS